MAKKVSPPMPDPPVLAIYYDPVNHDYFVGTVYQTGLEVTAHKPEIRSVSLAETVSKLADKFR